MRLRAIRLENVRRFTAPVEIAGIGDGINVLCAPNENGKSTVFDALHALFFDRHTSWTKELKRLVPHAGGDPSCAVELELGGDRLRIEKRWSPSGSRRFARISRNGTLVRQADEAEAWLSDRLRPPGDGGPSALFWVRQGVPAQDDDGNSMKVRQTLLHTVAGEVEAVTGGRELDTHRATCLAELAAFLTKNGKPKAGGPQLVAKAEVERLEKTVADRSEQVARMSGDLERRAVLRREIAAIDDPEAKKARTDRLTLATGVFRAAEQHHGALETALTSERVAKLERDQTAQALVSLKAALTERAVANETLTSARAAADEVRERLASADAQAVATNAARQTADERFRAARGTELAARNAAQAAAVATMRCDLVRQRGEAETARAAIEAARAEVRSAVDCRTWDRLVALDEAVRTQVRAREAGAPSVTVRYRDAGAARLMIAGRTLADAERIALPDGAAIEIDGVGTLLVQPGDGASASMLEAARQTLAKALAAAGQASLDAARASDQRRVAAEARCRDAEARLTALAPNGIDALQARIAELPEPAAADTELPSAADAADMAAAAEAIARAAATTYEAARESAERERLTLARCEAATEAASGRLDAVRDRLAAHDDPAAEKLRLEIGLLTCAAGHDAAAARRAALEAAAPDYAAVTAAMQRARAAVDHAREDGQRAREELSAVATRIDGHAADAVVEELRAAEEALKPARKTLEAREFEVRMLKRLEAELSGARDSAMERYLEPVVRELAPLVRMVWPEGTIRFDADKARPLSLTRGGNEERIDILSGGTQEQIALLVRLAFARLMARSGEAAPIILDDAIVFTDDDRIEKMFDALHRQAGDLQILVFSCRQKAFRELGGRSLAIAPAA